MAFRHLFNVFYRRSITTGLYSTTFLTVKCLSSEKENTKFQLSELMTEKMSFDYMIKQSTVDSVNNVSTMLTVIYNAIEFNSAEYRKLLLKLINLTRETIMFDVGDEHWDLILNTRLKLQNKKIIVTELTQYMDHVHKMATATTEICYAAGMDNLSHTLNQRIDDALNKMQSELQKNSLFEAEYTDIQKQSIDKSKKNVNDNIEVN